MKRGSIQRKIRSCKDYSFVADDGRDSIPLKYCYKCNEDLPLYEFHGNAYKYDGMQEICIDCRRKYKQTPKYKAYQKEYDKERNQTPERKARMKGYNKKYREKKKLERQKKGGD